MAGNPMLALGTRGRSARSGGSRGSAPRPTGRTPKVFQPRGRLGRAVASPDINIRGLQHFLRNKGYDVNVDGRLSPETKAALRDAILSGHFAHPSVAEEHLIHGMHGRVLSPKEFNHMVDVAGTPPYKPLVGKHGHGMLDSGGNSTGNAMGGLNPGQATGGFNGTVSDSQAQHSLKGANGQLIPAADAQFGTLFDVPTDAAAEAALQFQPQIDEAQLQMKRDPLQAAQNLKDIKDWYGQVQGSLAKARGQDTAATDAGVGSINDATKALVASLGGGANMGAGEVGAAGTNAAGTLQAIGNSQAGLDAELAPILAAEAAQAKTNQNNRDTAQAQSDRLALEGLQGQKGNAETAAEQQLTAANNSLAQARNGVLMNILQYNNAQRQQRFSNRMALLNSQIAAAMNGVGLQEKAAQANYYNARAAHEAGGGGFKPGQLNSITGQILGTLTSRGLIQSPQSGIYKMAPGVTPQQVVQAARSVGSSYGNLPQGFIVRTVLGGVQGF